ncbi:MAG: acyl-CoA thioesterase [Rubrivivax sp.]
MSAPTCPRRFARPRRIRFADCDPAGIVFFPHYLTMFVSLLEDFVTEELAITYAELLGARRIGLPTVSLACEFTHPSRMGDEVTLGLLPLRVGRTSITLALDCSDATRTRVAIRQTLVTTSLETHRPIPVPPDLRAALEAFDPTLRSASTEPLP